MAKRLTKAEINRAERDVAEQLFRHVEPLRIVDDYYRSSADNYFELNIEDRWFEVKVTDITEVERPKR